MHNCGMQLKEREMRMKHRVDAMVEVEKKDFFGHPKKVLEPHSVWVDDQLYSRMKQGHPGVPYRLEETSLFDELFD